MPIRCQFLFCCYRGGEELIGLLRRRRGREAEGGGLLNRYTVKSRIEGSNPSVSANIAYSPRDRAILQRLLPYTHNYTHNFVRVSGPVQTERPRSDAVVSWEGGTNKEG